MDKFFFIEIEKNNISESSKKTYEIIKNLNFDDIISQFLIKKIHYSLIIKNFKELEIILNEKQNLIKASNPEIITPEFICDYEIEKFFEDFLISLINYMKKCFENLREFISFCFTIKSKDEEDSFELTEGNQDILQEKEFLHITHDYFIMVLERINFYLLQTLIEEKNFLKLINSSNIIAFQFLKGFLEFEKNIKKQNFAKFYKLRYSISDLFLYNDKCLEKLQELLIIQKNFTENYFQSNISNVFSESLESESSNKLFVENTIFEKLKIIIKDNFCFLNAFEKSSEIFSIIYEQNYKYLIRELINFLRNIFNKQVSYFSSARKINKLNILYLIDFCIKFLCLKIKLLNKVKKSNWQPENKQKFMDFTEINIGSNLNVIQSNSISLLNNKISKINKENYNGDNKNCLFHEGLQILNNFITLLTKEFKEKSFSHLIELFEYQKLIYLDEEKIDTTCHNCNEDLKNLVFYIDSSNIKKEYEFIIFEIILTDILVRINEELEVSLKKNPKNILFSHLAERVKNIMNLLISKFNRKEDLKKDDNLKKLIKKFNSNMNTLRLYGI